MSQTIRLGVMGAGWPGARHAEGAKASGGFRVAAIADPIPERRAGIAREHPGIREFNQAIDLTREKDLDAVTVALPNHLHADLAVAALRAGKHVLVEKPPGLNAKDARRIAAAAEKSGKTVLYAFQRRFGGAEQASRQAIAKGYAGEIYHARAAWLRTRGVPAGTGWFGDLAKSGGGALIDLGVHLLDLVWWFMDQPRPKSVFAVTHRRGHGAGEVEDSAFAMIRFEGGRTLKLSAAWAINQPPSQQGTQCRLYGTEGCIDVYTPDGAVIYRQFDQQGESRPTPLKPPRLTGHAALMRHFRECILGKTRPLIGPAEGVWIMEMIDAMYKSDRTGKSVGL